VILPGTDVETARAICTRVKEIAKTKTATIIRPSIALGTAVKTDSEQNIYRIIMKAEARMYDNKLAESRQNQELVISSLLARSRQRWPGAESHISRALTLARTFGRALRLSDSQMEDIDLMIRLHDIGKVVIPDKVLRKPGRLSPKEWEKVRRYPEAGFRIVKTFAETARISDEMLAQRERWDGTGYPRGLQGEEIPYLARVMSVLDVYDVITHERPYKQALTSDEAVDILRQDAGKHFDPDLVRKFIGTVAGTP
jgi:HD-GYP domain-containing protein (c-di-GMP phosphodiesterase class II)